MRHFSRAFVLVGVVGLGGGCLGEARDLDEGDASGETVASMKASTYTVSGAVSGSTGAVTLRNNADSVTVRKTGGPFAFPTPLAAGATYNVTVATQPAGQTCTVANGTGTVGTANVTNVFVQCGATPPPNPTYTVGGTVSGLVGTLVLRDNGGDDLWSRASGGFTFPTALTTGSGYAVTVAQQPTGQTCTVTNGTGTVAGASVTSVAVACATTPPANPAYYVDAATGSDTTGTGAAGAPWRTITKAVNTAPTTGADIHVAPGTYGAGETFPIAPHMNQHLIGDVAHRGEGTTPTRISGAGSYTCGGGDLGGFAVDVAVGIEASSTGSSVEGFSIAGGNETVWICSAAVTFAHNTVAGSTDTAVLVGHGASVTLTDNAIHDGAYGLLAYDWGTKVTARGNVFSGSTNHAVVLGFTNPFVGSYMDFGTAASPGNNTMLGSSVGVGLSFAATTATVVTAAGNTWQPNKQGSDASGHYAAQLVTGNVGVVGGANYATRFTTGGGLQL